MKGRTGVPQRCQYLVQNRDGTFDAGRGGTGTIADSGVTLELANGTFFDTAVFSLGQNIRPDLLEVANGISMAPNKRQRRQTRLNRVPFSVCAVCTDDSSRASQTVRPY